MRAVFLRNDHPPLELRIRTAAVQSLRRFLAFRVFEILRPVGEIFQEGEAGLDVLAGDVGEAVCREGLAGEGCDDRAIDDGLAEIVEGEFPFPGGG